MADNRGIGLIGTMAIGIGGMVGGGIFAVLGVVAQAAGGGAPVSFAVAGVVAFLTAVSYAHLSVTHPSRGGTVVFVDRVFGIGTLTGALNNLLWFSYLVTLALYATAFGNYAATFFYGDSAPPGWAFRLLVSLAILIPTGLNLLSASTVARTETTIVGLKLAMLALVGTVGFGSVSGARLDPGNWPSLGSVAGAGMLVFVAYEGFELIANSAEDVRRPKWTLPRAFYLSVVVVLVLYVVIAIITVGSLSPAQIAKSADFALAEAARPTLGQTGFLIVAGSAVLATLSAINATIYGAARLSYSIASEGELPEVLEKKVWSEPAGLILTSGAALVLANTLDLTSISAMASAGFLIVFGAVNAAAWREARSASRRWIATGGVLGCGAALVVLLVDAVRRRPLSVVVLVAVVVLAVVGELWWLRGKRSISLPHH